MSAAPSPYSVSPSRRGTSLPFGGHGVEVAGEHDPPVAAEVGAHDDVVADPVDRAASARARATRCSTMSASRVSSRLTDGIAISSSVSPKRSSPLTVTC